MPRRTLRTAQLQPLEPRRLLTAFVVNTLSDTTDPADALLTLREAITQANASAGPDSITFAPALTGSLKLDPGQGQLDITDALTITGPGAPTLAVDAQNASRIFDIASGATASISNLTLTNGRAPIQQDGGGIRNAGTLTLTSVVLSHNIGGDGGTSVSTVGPAGGNGGAIYNAGTLTVRDSALLDNAAGRGADGLDAFDFGGLGGRGGDGGAIYNEDGATLTLLNSTLARNKAGDGGNGGNVSPFFGGEGGRGGNGGSGGGVANVGAATLVNASLTANASGNGGFGGTGATFGRPGFYGDGGGLYNDGTSFKIANTLAAKNDPGAASPDAYGTFNSLGHNLIAVADGSSGWLASDKTGTDFQPVDAKLGDVNFHGGPTPTLALLAASPAIDAADSALADGSALATDQRGYARKYAAAVDIGALEYNSALAGDANRDDRVNFSDLLVLAKNYNQSGKTWADGDFSGDGTVNFADLLTLAKNYNRTLLSPPPTPAPTPAVADQNPVLATAAASTFSTRKITKPTPATRAKR